MSRHAQMVMLATMACLAACDDTVTFATDDPWVADPDWPGIGAGKIMVTNSGDDTLSFLDPETLEPVYLAPTGRIPAEREGPHHGAATDDGEHYFVGISNFVPGSGSGPHGSHGNGTVDGYLLRYRTSDNVRDGEVRVERSPGDVRITPNGAYVIQTHFDLQSIFDAVDDGEDPSGVLSAVAVIDAETMERVAMIPVCPAGHGVALAPDSSAAYVACWGSDELGIVSLDDPAGDPSVERVAVGIGGGDPTAPRHGPYAATVTGDGGQVWISNLEGKSVAVYDTETGAMDEQLAISLAGSPLFPTWSADESLLYLPQQSPDALLTVERATGTVLDTLPMSPSQCVAPHGTLLLASQTELALVCEGDHIEPGTVVRLSLDSDGLPSVETSYPVGVYPDDLVFIPGAP